MNFTAENKSDRRVTQRTYEVENFAALVTVQIFETFGALILREQLRVLPFSAVQKRKSALGGTFLFRRMDVMR